MVSQPGVEEGGAVLEPQGAAMRALYSVAARIAPRNIPVLVTGETGVGKEVLVRRIHQQAGRQGPLSVVNCAALPPELTETILFGHERGAFTGADRATTGAVEAADAGTLFLDEIGELNARAQASLLRVLQDKRVMRVGSIVTRTVDVRVIAATHRNLEALARDGRFRSDLLYRLNAITLAVPPLRERRDEIRPLAQHFATASATEWGVDAATFSARALDALDAYDWPGNVRQLRNVIQCASALRPGNVLDLQDLPSEVAEHARGAAASPSVSPPESAVYAPAFGTFRQSMRQYEVKLIVDSLRRCQGNLALAAELLQLPLRTLSYKINRHQIRHRADWLTQPSFARHDVLDD